MKRRNKMGFKDEILCSKSHEYVLKQNNEFIIGLTDYAIEQLGDIVFLELPEIGNEYSKGDSFANIESVKAASEIYMPISGKIIAVNSLLSDEPEKLNEDCYETGWLVKIESTAPADEFEDLMSYEDYKKELE